MKNDEAKDEKWTVIEEPYTCSSCGRENLKLEDIISEDKRDHQIDDSTVCCKTCGFLKLWPSFKKMIKPGCEKEGEKLFKKMMKDFEYNYNRRLLRRAVKKKD